MAKNKTNVLIVDDEEEILKSLSRILDSKGYNSFIAKSAEEALEILKINRIDIVLSDIVMPGMDGITLLKEIKTYYSYIHVIMLTAYGTIESSIEAIKIGAFGYLVKPFNVEEIFNELLKVEKLITLENENMEFKKKENEQFHVYQSNNSYMKEILKLIATKIAPSESIVFISGESGTGKEIIANYIQKLSNRSHGPFIKVSCAALSEGVLESELFGHVKGAFTGAIKDKIGRFEAANSGTIFLDEIGDLSPKIQLKLLRVLQERTIEKVGHNSSIKVDVRIIVATNKNLEELVAEGKFREDLFYRINVININMPSLRNRREDIPLLVETFIKKYAARNNLYISHLEEEALNRLMSYKWTGNIRELENVIERAVVLSDNGFITLNHFDGKIFNDSMLKPREIIKLKTARDKFEKEFITEALRNNKKNVSKTSKILGITRKNLYEKMKKLDIQ